jgi:L,D-transpeptidase YbiS
VRLGVAGGGALALAGLAVALLGTGVDYAPLAEAPQRATAEASPAALRRERERLRATLRRLTPRGPWLVIDQTHNRLRLMRGERLVLEAPCSAGSGRVLRESSGGRVWTFDTPRGAFRVRNRLENPVWRKPDWAFVEEGRPVPSDPGERFESGVLGAYALDLGDGYMIHGTLYERLLGRPVSHGCIRVGREPLRRLWEALPLGAPIYIF